MTCSPNPGVHHWRCSCGAYGHGTELVVMSMVRLHVRKTGHNGVGTAGEISVWPRGQRNKTVRVEYVEVNPANVEVATIYRDVSDD